MPIEPINVPFFSFSGMHPQLKTRALAAFGEFFESGSFVLGDRLKEFENTFARACGTTYCAGVSNGLDALVLALKAAGVGNGDEVILPSNTFIATALAVIHAGAIPVLAEPDEATYNITAAGIAPLITRKTRAVIPVHLYGQACEMAELISLAEKEGLLVIEDNAQAQGAACNGKPTGSWGAVNATSFYPAKNLGAFGDAGAVTTDNPELDRRVRILRNYGSEIKYEHVEPGHNMRLDELQATLLSLKLEKLSEWNSQRQRVAKIYNELLGDLPGVVLPAVAEGSTHVYHLYVIRVQHREKLQAYLAGRNIGTMIHYPLPLHRQKALAGHKFPGNFGLTEKMVAEILSIPVWPGMSDDQAEYVASAIRKYFGK